MSPDEQTAVTEPADERTADTFGVLFVHGIGLQKRAETLVEWGEIVADWLRRWLNFGHTLSPDETTHVEVVETRLGLDDPADAAAPAHSRLGFRLGQRTNHRSWLLAESWWASTFDAPRLRDVLHWAIVVVPRATVIHFVPRMRFAMADLRYAQTLDARERFRFDRRGVGGVLRCLIGLPFLAGLAIVVEAAIVALGVLSLVPIESVRNALRSAQSVLARVIGDSFVFLESPIRQSSTITKVQSDLQWLTERCGRVVVVAHSQGAAVAHAALERLKRTQRLPDELAGLVTVGSGVRKLYDLRSTAERPVVWGFVGAAAMIFSLGFLAALGGWAFGSLPPWLAVLALLVSLVVLLGTLFMAEALCRKSPDHVGRPWIDYYASHDPVPNGPMLAEREVPREALGLGAPATEVDRHMRSAMESMEDFVATVYRAQSREVVNRESYLHDHNDYWSSTDDFVSRLMLDVARLGDFPLERATADRLWVPFAAARRRWRVDLLRGFRWALGALAAAVLVRHSEVLAPIGEWVASSLGALSRGAWVERIRDAPILLGCAAVAAAWLAAYSFGATAWKSWQRRDLAAFFRRDLATAGGAGLVGFVAIFWLSTVAAGWSWFARPGALFVQGSPLAAGAAVLAGTGWALWLHRSFKRAPGGRRDWGLLVLTEADRLARAGDERREEANYALARARTILDEDEKPVADGEEDTAELPRLERTPELDRVLIRYGLGTY